MAVTLPVFWCLVWRLENQQFKVKVSIKSLSLSGLYKTQNQVDTQKEHLKPFKTVLELGRWPS